MSSKNPPVDQDSLITEMIKAFGEDVFRPIPIPTEEELQEALSKRVMGGPNCIWVRGAMGLLEPPRPLWYPLRDNNQTVSPDNHPEDEPSGWTRRSSQPPDGRRRRQTIAMQRTGGNSGR